MRDPGEQFGTIKTEETLIAKEDIAFLKRFLIINHIDNLPRSHKMIRVNRFYMLGNLGMPQCNSIRVTYLGRWESRVTSKEGE